ncbi:MAG: D-glycero-beta-D-manno-heptose-7-phosphate kinase [Bacteroidetes bacterium]|nr:D-glycero-beta-D-manno-heptose-7-phosphate kinase [Bacteroidota bacterium]NOG95029.1 D-glycero-beta-D-manno-heptose-7-phosphate kinase [Bacteroidota bacterium]
MVIGDIMLDSYIIGTAYRISPEAPVPVVNVQKKENRPGGAANVAVNLKSLGAQVSMCAVLGNDEEGNLLLASLKKAGIYTDGIIKDETRNTTTKTRIVASNHQMLRVDSESCEPVNQNILNDLVKYIQVKIEKKQCDVIIFEDYDKGLLCESFIQKVVEIANNHKIPVVVDPKKNNFFSYKKVTLFKPNLKELNEGMNVNIPKNDLPAIQHAVKELNQKLNAETIMLTLSENGVLLYTSNSFKHIKAHSRQIADVSGAGDTVISVAALCVAMNVKADFMAELSNIAGGLVCEKAGVVPVNKDELFKETSRLIYNTDDTPVV